MSCEHCESIDSTSDAPSISCAELRRLLRSPGALHPRLASVIPGILATLDAVIHHYNAEISRLRPTSDTPFGKQAAAREITAGRMQVAASSRQATACRNSTGDLRFFWTCKPEYIQNVATDGEFYVLRTPSRAVYNGCLCALEEHCSIMLSSVVQHRSEHL